MEYNEVKQRVRECPQLAGLDEASLATLFWRGEERVLDSGEAIYSEQTDLDDTFCLLLSGSVQIEKEGIAVGEISGEQIFGEMAYFTSHHARTATVRAGSPRTSVLKVQLTRAELATRQFSALKRFLGLEAWDRFVSSSQNLAP